MGARWSKFYGKVKSKIGIHHRLDEKDSDCETEFGGGNVKIITKVEAWDEKLLEAKRLRKIAILNFSATWCDPCKMIAPYYRELSEKYPSLMFLVIDVDEMTEFSILWDIKATPTFFFVRDGRPIDKFVGANKSELTKKIAVVADSLPPIDTK